MKDKSTIIGAGLAAFALLVIVIGIVLFFFGNKGDDLPSSPNDVYDKLSSMSQEEQEKKILALTRYDPKDPRSDEALVVLRKLVKETSLSPQTRAAVIRGLGARKDIPSLLDVAECLYLDDEKDYVVRKAAVEACIQTMGINITYDAAGPPDERKRVADEYVVNAKLWQRMRGDKGAK